MDFRYLDAFLSAARHLNFSQAAAELQIAPSALSRQIQLFEESLQTQLFIRSPRKVALTELGKKTLKYALQFQNQMREVQAPSDTNQTLRIATLQSVLESRLLGSIETYLTKYNASIDIVVGKHETQMELLKQHKVDCIFTNKREENSLFTSQRLYQEKFEFISKHPFDYKKLPQLPQIILSPLEHLWTDLKLRKHTSNKQEIHVNSYSAALHLAARGLGVTILPEAYASPQFRIYRKPLIRKQHDSIYLTQWAHEKTPQHLKSFLQLF